MTSLVNHIYIQFLIFFLDQFGDGIFEPGSEVTIQNIVLENNGGLTLPEGAQLKFLSNDIFQFKTQSYTLPQIKPNERITIERSFSGILCSIDKNEKSYIEFRVELHNRVFRDSIIKKEIITKCPIQVSNVIFIFKFLKD